jgi:gamma-glutamyl-gamma-aminobutyrate hydrolase PuuD
VSRGKHRLAPPPRRLTPRSTPRLALVAAPLATVARAPDGIVEGVEWPTDDWWMVGVQWHPEELTASPEPWDRSLLSTFADVVSRARRLS